METPRRDGVRQPVDGRPYEGTIAFGAERTRLEITKRGAVLHVAIPILSGDGAETLIESDRFEPCEGGAVFSGGLRFGGFFAASSEAGLEQAAVALYRRIFKAAAGRHLHRLWNFVPRLNETVAGLENYRLFCRGRSLAFEEQFGNDYPLRLPAASGVGSEKGVLAIAFVAGVGLPTHFENPDQVPAFEYPLQYGPRSPSFSRATTVGAGREQRIYISGTAAIRGHSSVAPGDLSGQLDCTLDNLRRIGAIAGAGGSVGVGWRRSFRIYIRRAEDLAPVQARLATDLLQPGDRVHILRADICRSDLLVEIEALLEPVV